MHAGIRLVKGTLFLLVLSAGLTGCNDALKMDNQRLTDENIELRETLARTQAALDTAVNERDALLAQLNSRPAPPPPIAPVVNTNRGFEDIEGVETIRTRDTVTVRVPGDVLFASGQATLQNASKSTLQRIAGVVKSQYPNNQIRIEGHTDSDPIRKSKWENNYHLGEARAAAVRDYLAQQGVGAARMQVVSQGPDKPVASNTSTAGKSRNRRVEIVVLVPQ
jgi:flagellar motor protein MotB